MTDFIKPFMLNKGLFRGDVVKCNQTVSKIIKNRDYPLPIAGLLAKSVVLSALLASSIKYDGVFTLQIRGEGGCVSAIVVDITHQGAIRAYANFDKNKLDKITSEEIKDRGEVPALINAGYMLFTVDNQTNNERYQGTVELEGRMLEDCALLYFKRSAQIKTAIKISVEVKSNVAKAGGIILQQMPALGGDKELDMTIEEIDEAWNTAVILLASLKDSEMLDDKLAPDDLLFRLYHEQQATVFPDRELFFSCRCSKKRVQKVLSTISKEELKAVAKNGKVKITCEFCGKSYDVPIDIDTKKAKKGG